MRQRYRVCDCSPDCTLKIKVNSCEVTSYIAVYHERDAKGFTFLSYTCLRMRQSMTSDWKILRNFGNQHLKLLILRSVVVAVGGF